MKKYLWILPALFLVVSITVWGFNAKKGEHPLVNRSVVNEFKASNVTRSENDNALSLLDELIQQSEVAEKNVQEGDQENQWKVNRQDKRYRLN